MVYIKKIKPRIQHRPKGTRASRTNAELLKRRFEVYRLWSAGIPTSEIADRYFITVQAVHDDLKAIKEIENPVDAKEKIDAGYKEIIRRVFDYETKDKPELKAALLRVAVEALARRAELHGFRKDVNQINFNQTQILNANAVVNQYDKLDDATLEKEFIRRKAVFTKIKAD